MMLPYIGTDRQDPRRMNQLMEAWIRRHGSRNLPGQLFEITDTDSSSESKKDLEHCM
jgi:hypothetical protein